MLVVPRLGSLLGMIPLAALLGAAAPASAAPRLIDSLAILPIVVAGPHGQASVSDIYDAVTRATRPRLGLRVISSEEIFVASREGLLERVADCGTDDGCIASKLRMFDARFCLVVVLSFELGPPIYSLRLLDTDAGRKVGERVGEATGDVWADITGAADGLLTEAGLVESGRVVVEVIPPKAQLRLRDGPAPDPGTPNVFTLPPGRYTVEASAEDHDPGAAVVDVVSGRTESVTVTLTEQTSVWASPWLWIAVGAVVVGGTTAAVVATQRPDPCLCTTLNGEGCICR